jgi:hypothetical protein
MHCNAHGSPLWAGLTRRFELRGMFEGHMTSIMALNLGLSIIVVSDSTSLLLVPAEIFAAARCPPFQPAYALARGAGMWRLTVMRHDVCQRFSILLDTKSDMTPLALTQCCPISQNFSLVSAPRSAYSVTIRCLQIARIDDRGNTIHGSTLLL